MSFLKRLFGRSQPEPQKNDHAVLVVLRLSDESFGESDERESIHELSTQLEECIARTRTGEFDGDEFGEGECTLYMYGPDADKLFGAIEKVLRASRHAKGGQVVKRYGPAGDPSVRKARIEL